MVIKTVGLNEIINLSVSVIDTDEYEVEWNGYTIQVRSMFTLEHIFVDEYIFINEDGAVVRGTRTTNKLNGSYSYGPAADLIKRYMLRGCTVNMF